MTASGAALRSLAYGPEDAAAWDAFVATSANGTLLHTRRFLAYHGSRFTDRSLLIRDDRDRLVGVMPAAEDPDDAATVVSHPGITYGGVVHGNFLRGEKLITAFSQVSHHFAGLGYTCLRYKAVPWIYHRRLAGDDSYALFRMGAARSRCELCAALDLMRAPSPADRRRSGLQLALRKGVTVRSGWGDIDRFWRILQATLAERYGATPTHTREEIDSLHDRFPDEIELVVGLAEDDVIAGAVLFAAGDALHLQYTASTGLGRETSAMDAVLAQAIESARARQLRFFSFGTSNQAGGRVLNHSLYDFKLSFGAGSVVQEQYDLALPAAAA